MKSCLYARLQAWSPHPAKLCGPPVSQLTPAKKRGNVMQAETITEDSCWICGQHFPWAILNADRFSVPFRRSRIWRDREQTWGDLGNEWGGNPGYPADSERARSAQAPAAKLIFAKNRRATEEEKSFSMLQIEESLIIWYEEEGQKAATQARRRCRTCVQKTDTGKDQNNGKRHPFQNEETGERRAMATPRKCLLYKGKALLQAV